MTGHALCTCMKRRISVTNEFMRLVWIGSALCLLGVTGFLASMPSVMKCGALAQEAQIAHRSRAPESRAECMHESKRATGFDRFFAA